MECGQEWPLSRYARHSYRVPSDLALVRPKQTSLALPGVLTSGVLSGPLDKLSPHLAGQLAIAPLDVTPSS